MSVSASLIVDYLKSNTKSKVLIVTHTFPDGDGASCCLAVSEWLTYFGVEHIVWIPEGLPSYLEGLAHKKRVRKKYPDYFNYNTVISLDASSFERIAFNHLISKTATLINIDHHQDNTSYGDINWTEDRSSVGEMLAKLQQDYSLPINYEIATMIYTAIAYDTGQFKHDNCSSQTHQFVSKLLNYGVSTSNVSKTLFENVSLDYFEKLHCALSHVAADNESGLIYTYLDEAQLDIEGSVIDVLRQWRNTRVAAVFQALPDNFVKVSLRSESLDVAHFAKAYGGGGHKKAAGIRLEGKLLDVVELLITKLKEALANERLS